VLSVEQMGVAFDEAISDGGTTGAERLCRSCVDVLEVDGAAISLMSAGQPWGTLGASGDLSRHLDELQFTFGEGPCLDAVNLAEPVLVPDLGRADQTRWPAFTTAVLSLNIRGVFALPIAHGAVQVGALDLFRHEPGELSRRMITGGLLAAKAAAVPLVQIMRNTAAENASDDNSWPQRQSATWERVEVYQATGMIMVQLDVGKTEALVRLRGHAFAYGMTATEVAQAVIAGTVVLADDAGSAGEPDHEGRP
jgi:hypothetical protein